MNVPPPSIRFSAYWLSHCLGRTATARQRALSLCAFGSALVLVAWLTVAWQRSHDAWVHERDALRARSGQLSLRKPVPKAVSPARPPPDAARQNVAVSQLNIPWSDVFDGLERHVNADVGLTTLEPDTKTGMLRVQAEARSISGLLVYADQLSHDAAFYQLTLHQHETNEQDPNRPARLSFEVRLQNSGADVKVGP